MAQENIYGVIEDRYHQLVSEMSMIKSALNSLLNLYCSYDECPNECNTLEGCVYQLGNMLDDSKELLQSAFEIGPGHRHSQSETLRRECHSLVDSIVSYADMERIKGITVTLQVHKRETQEELKERDQS